MVSIETDIGSHAPCVMAAQGVLSHWRASDERRGVMQAIDRDDIAGLYDVGDASIDITEMTTAYVVELDGEPRGLIVDVSADVTMTVTWRV